VTEKRTAALPTTEQAGLVVKMTPHLMEQKRPQMRIGWKSPAGLHNLKDPREPSLGKCIAFSG
jgi:hypothetical protein